MTTLNEYLNELLTQKNILNSQAMRDFLELEKFADDILYLRPQPILILDLPAAVPFAHLCFEHNFLVLCLNQGKHSKLAILSALPLFVASHRRTSSSDRRKLSIEEEEKK